MFNRPIHPQPFAIPADIALPETFPIPLENVSHVPGQAAAIRFFDPHSLEDLQAMREILRGKQVKKWMDDAHQISQSEYRDWAGTQNNSSFLFGALDARSANPHDMKDVRGFVYIYSEREEKFRVRRMEKAGFIAPANPAGAERYLLEVSFAMRPFSDGSQTKSGLMSSALRQSCLQVKTLLNMTSQPEVQIFAFVDPENEAARRTLEAAGFENRGSMKYDWDSPDETCLYFINWELLQAKLTTKLLEGNQAMG